MKHSSVLLARLSTLSAALLLAFAGTSAYAQSAQQGAESTNANAGTNKKSVNDGSGQAGVTLSATAASGVTAEQALAPVSVSGSTESVLQTKTLPSYKFTAPLRDTPRSVTVITDELLKETGATSFSDALRTVPGITFLGGDAAANPSADRPVIRGFESRNSIFVDGMRDDGVQNRETFDVENISVIKGPDSVYAGRGAVGGSVDITTKVAKADNFDNGSVGVGTDGYKRMTIDTNHMVGDNAAFRLNLMGHDANQAGRTDIYSKRWGVAPSVVFGLHSPTTVTVSYYHLSTYDMPDFSVPFRSTGGTPINASRGQFFGLNSRDYRRGTTDTGEIRVDHTFDDNWKLRNTTVIGRSTLDYIATNPQLSSATGNTLWLEAKSGKYALNNIANQTELTGTFSLFGVRNTITGGVEFTHQNSVYEGYLVSDSAGANLRNATSCTVAGDCVSYLGGWDPNRAWTGSIQLNADSFPGKALHTQTNIASAYLFDTAKLTDRWQVNLGARFDRYNANVTQQNVASLNSTSNLFSYQGALVFKPVETMSLYTSYGTSSNPPGSNAGLGGGNDQLLTTNQNLSPERSRNIEVGAKWDVLRQRLSLTGALFQMDKTNARVSDGLGNLINAGHQRVRGTELGVVGNVTEKWLVQAGYSYLNAVTVDAGKAQSSASGLPMVMVPRHNFTLWTTYQATTKLTVGGGATFSSLTYASVARTGSAPAVEKWIPGYAKFDAMLSYKINKYTDVQLNVLNIFDRKYFSSAYPIYATWAPGRSAMVTMHFYH
ncbi:TonB-dependent receptor [Robbsia andropogonis]|uniref:TonB-dependent receptor n=1 Tax=Robbsia andropogonis TaxID=28092 RepID=UPI00209DABF0|nr:TonB-dependent siderophore receptor [Robbsia andropogonis]MCP1117324.1 TonB-dependent siderophore receptor [Robbsia andropogonis]MCP1129281.1 TonB-dependent siderophore receptor [Robbsia andropogonis]